MTYADGSTTIVPTTGGEWKVGESGTITNNIYLGERFESRMVDTLLLLLFAVAFFMAAFVSFLRADVT